MRDKIALLMRETGCAQGEAELALEMCAYDIEQALAAIPRLFQNIAVIRGKVYVEQRSLYALFLAILQMRNRSLLRARSVVSYNPAVYVAPFDPNWFEYEKRLYACRLGTGADQELSQDLEYMLADFFASPESLPLYSERKIESRGKPVKHLELLLGQRFWPSKVKLELVKDVLDLAQFHEMQGLPAQAQVARSAPKQPQNLVLRVALEGAVDGTPASELSAGDCIYAKITDSRDIARYLARILHASASASTLLVPIEAVERTENQICVRVRFSAGVCGDVTLPDYVRIRVLRK